MSNINIFGTLHNVTGEPIAKAAQIKDDTLNKTQAEINQIAIAGGVTEIHHIVYNANNAYIEEAAGAVAAGKIVVCLYSPNDGNSYYLICHKFDDLTTGKMYFSGIFNNTLYYCDATPSVGWSAVSTLSLSGGGGVSSVKKGNFDTFDVTLPSFPNNAGIELTEAQAKAMFNVSTLAELFSVVGAKITQGYFAKVSYTEDNVTQTSICNCYVFGDDISGRIVVVGEFNGRLINIMVKVASSTFNRCVIQTSPAIQPLSTVALSGDYDDLSNKPTIDNTPTQNSNNLVKSGGVYSAIVNTVAESGVFDLSVHNAVNGVLATYADLSAALTALNALSSEYKKPGMSFKFVQSSDNKYVQYRLLTEAFSINVDDWEQSASVAQLEELEDNVVMTGSYDATVAVGLADNLRGNTIVNTEFYKQKTGGTQSVGSGIAAIKEVRGKSIVWNQLVQNGNFETTSGWQTSNCSLRVSDNIATITLTETSGRMQQSVSIISGHKYYISSKGDGTKKLYNTSTSEASAFLTKRSSILPASTNYNTLHLWYYGSAGNSFTLFNVKIIDLTIMFGAGNEPATVEDFEKMFPLDYYDYNAGEVIPFAGQNLTTIGKNQYNPATGKANLLGGQTYQLLGTYTGAEIDGVAVILDSNNCFTTTKDCVLDVTGGNDTDTIVALYNGENVTYEPYEKHTLPLDPSQWRDKDGNLVFPYGGMHGVGTAYDYAKVDADGYVRKAVRVYERRAYESGDVTSDNIITDGRTYTFYQLAEPVEVELATPVYAKYLVDKDGTEEITPANGTTPYTTMANLSILYAMDARGEIKNLPKNYLSKESAENMLNAMVSAGVIASYTMTWDSTNNRYAFVITKPAEETQS